MKQDLYLIEFYVKNPVTGEEGYDIYFAWVYAGNKENAFKKLIFSQIAYLDETISITEHSEIVPLAGDLIEGVNLFTIY